MSRLFLVRHGQASFLEANYDRLSPKGEDQARMLGEYWARHNTVLDRVYSGPRVRQAESARLAGQTYAASGLNWPQPTVMTEFDEFQAEAVMERSLPGLVERDSAIRKIHETFKAADSREQQFKLFQRLFEIVIGQWVAGEIVLPDIEPWPVFCTRVSEGLTKIAAHGDSDQNVAVFSSGGPVGIAMQRALGLTPQAALRTAWMVRNGAYSEFLFSGDRFTLSAYNCCPHLTDPAFLTYR